MCAYCDSTRVPRETLPTLQNQAPPPTKRLPPPTPHGTLPVAHETTAASRETRTAPHEALPAPRESTVVSCATKPDSRFATRDSRESHADSATKLNSPRERVDARGMKVLPAGRQDLIQFAIAHIDEWAQDPAAVGLSQSQIDAMREALDGATKAFERAQQLRDEAQAATLTSNTNIAMLRAKLATAVSSIKAFARVQEESGVPEAKVYAAARIDEPRTPSPLPSPTQIRNVRLHINQSGSAVLSWTPPPASDARERSAGRTGVWYEIERKPPGAREFAGVGGTAEKTFTDTPLAVGQTQYRVRARRGDRAGPWSLTVSATVGVGVGVGSTIAPSHARAA